jgi:hypothetical protein
MYKCQWCKCAKCLDLGGCQVKPNTSYTVGLLQSQYHGSNMSCYNKAEIVKITVWIVQNNSRKGFKSFQTILALILARSTMFEYYINNIGLQCNIQLYCFPIAFVLNIIKTVAGWTKVGPEGPDVNPGRLGRFSNIFFNYAGLLCLQCNIKCFNCHNCF